jgi:hypothetical protein
LKFPICTHGQTIQFFVNALLYVLSSFFCGDVPSITAMVLRNTKRLQGAKMNWSRPTRATIVALGLRRFTLVERNLNQVVAAGPKIAGLR